MPKFTLIAEHTDIYGKPTGQKVTYEFKHDNLDNVLEDIDLFLRGVGFSSVGVLDYRVDEWSDHGGGSTLEDYEMYEDIQHDQSYFDTTRNK